MGAMGTCALAGCAAGQGRPLLLCGTDQPSRSDDAAGSDAGQRAALGVRRAGVLQGWHHLLASNQPARITGRVSEAREPGLQRQLLRSRRGSPGGQLGLRPAVVPWAPRAAALRAPRGWRHDLPRCGAPRGGVPHHREAIPPVDAAGAGRAGRASRVTWVVELICDFEFHGVFLAFKHVFALGALGVRFALYLVARSHTLRGRRG
mmetsp:Transcript_3790/g.9847  ORF Transcript_3790/g.9847 Transcript_3790/m.9847 type:complete len:205 (-) Transcript_3790:6-620(-)